MEKFTYKDYMYWRKSEIFKNKLQTLVLKEDSEEYILSKTTHHPYDKTFRVILSDREEAAKFINKALKLNKNRLKGDDIEKYATRFVTSEFENSESDIVYRKKNTNIFFLIEHQSKIDYSMPYRILTYNMEIIKSSIFENKIKEKNYKWPVVYPIVLYTGKKKWDVKKYFEECQEYLEECNERVFTYYNLLDINDIKERELWEENNFLSKILLLEKVTTKDLEKNLIKVTKTELTKKEKQMLSQIIYYNLSKRLGKEKAIFYSRKILEEEEKEMAAIDDYICMVIDRALEEKERKIKEGTAKGRAEGRRQGRAEGRAEGRTEERTQLIIEMLKNNLDEKTIKAIAKISNKELEEIKQQALCQK